MTHRTAAAVAVAVPLLAGVGGCRDHSTGTGHLEAVWGQRGISDGRLQKPRAMAIGPAGCLYIVDMTARIQVFTPDGRYLRHWQTPESAHGKPSGLSFDRAGNLLVADTHYFRMLVYTPQGKLLKEKTIGGRSGQAPGEFGFVTDAVQDSQGNYYISEYGEYDRIQKFSSQGEFLFQWGGHGAEPGRFVRPENMAIDRHDHVWVADACNHRIQAFDATGREAKLVRIWGEPGSEPGKLKYPYDLVLDGRGHVYVCEFGNHRVQKFTLDGRSLGVWGSCGREKGQLYQPWGLARDRDGNMYVLDTYNHRVQKFTL